MHRPAAALADRLLDTWGPSVSERRDTWSRTIHPLEADGAVLYAPSISAGTEDVRLRSELGHGGMGAVWLADQASLGREVAVKIPHPGRTAEAALRAEARVAGGLEHPHIVPVHALITDADGRPMMVMKRVEGATLGQLETNPAHPVWPTLLSRHGTREAMFLECLVRVADALAFAHSRGVTHRDVKLDNILIGAFGEAYLMDWGCAVALGTTAPIAGTPAFMAPEMLNPERGAAHARTDVYLLGATLHAALTGTPRHDGSDLPALLAAVAASEPVAYGGEVPADLAAICNRATAADPADRHSSMEELRAALVTALRLRTTLSVVGRIVERALVGPDEAPEPDRLRRLREAHHALEPLAQEWPDQAEVREPLDRVRSALVRCALGLGLLAEAEAVYADLPAPPAELVAALTKARAEEEAARRHSRVGADELRERDVRPSLQGQVAMVVFMIANAVFLVAAIEGGGTPTMQEVFLTDLVALAVLGAGGVWFRGTLLANRRGRSTTAAVFLVVLGTSASDGLSALVGQSAADAAPFSIFASGFGFAALATLLEAPRRSRWIAAACAAGLLAEAVVAAVRPGVAVTLLSVSVVQAVAAAGLLVMEMIREGQRRG